MKILPTAPAPGTPVCSSLIRELIAAIKARTILRGRGYRTRETPNGIMLEIEVAKSARPVAKTPGCFEIRRPSGEADPGGFDNPYFMVGANLYQCAEAIDMGFDYDDCIIALCVNTTSESPQAFVDVFVDFTAIQEAAKSRSVAIHPLYLIGEGGRVLADLRNIPVFPQWEYKAN